MTVVRRITAGILALAVFTVQLALPPAAEASHPGSSTASAGSVPPPGVTAIQSFQPDLFTGRATTGIPLAVPPGRKGMQPSLGLTYSSSARNGWVGVGWGLDLGYIERSTKNGPPRYDASDTYTFMFQGVASDLVRIPDGTYRAKDEGLFLRFESLGISGWEVRDKSGTRYLFGGLPDAEQTNPSGTFRWGLRKVVDTNGNFLTVNYSKDQGLLYPARIDYTGHEVSGVQDLAPANAVVFTLEPRPDPDVSFRSGAEVRTAQRLKDVATFAGGALARRYRLTYQASARSGRSLLASVTQVGHDDALALPPATFTYQDTQTPTYALTSNGGATAPVGYNVSVAVHDFRHETFGCNEAPLHPYAGLNYSSPQVVTGGTSIGCVSVSTGGDGTITVSSCQDRYIHAWIWLYRASPGSISLATSGNEGSFCTWSEVGGTVSAVPQNGSYSVPAGWSILHLTTHHEHSSFTARQTNALSPQVQILSAAPFLKPQLAGDVDGNGITDLITLDAANGTWTVAKSRGGDFSPATTWLSGFGDASFTPVLGDWNGDGMTDIAIYKAGTWHFATSTATAFQADALPSLAFGSGTPLTGDFNGDGIVDLGTYNRVGASGLWTVALGTGSGFAPAGSFSLDFGDTNYDPLTGDFNGDGLTDVAVVRRSAGDVLVATSTGTQFTVQQPSTWISAFGAGQPHTSADFNGDGLTDAAYYDKSTGQVIVAHATGVAFAAPAALPVTFGLRSNDDSLQVGDFNGDGLADPAVFNSVNGASEMAKSQGASVDLLSQVRNGLGGATTIEYQPSTRCDNFCPIEETPQLPFVLPVVNRVSADNGLGHQVATTYFFHLGRYDAPTREFRGFARAEVRDADATASITRFHQDDQKKGRPFRTEVQDQFGALWSKQEQAWSSAELYPGVIFTRLDQTDAYTYDGDATFRQTRSRFTYDQFGNIIRVDSDGEVGVTGDERAAVTSIVPNTSAWILGKPSLVQTLDAAGAVVAQRRFFYDGATSSTAAPVVGNLTKEEEWLNFPAPAWLATSLAYDAYGNVSSVTDALERQTLNTYDAGGTYLTRIQNALGHARQLTYDARTGQVLTSTDANGQTTTTEYDALGRVTRVIGPNDTAALPTMAYEYDLSAVPARTTVRTRIQSGQPDVLTVHSFADGLGRTVQTRSPAEDPLKQVVTGAFELNAKGQVIKQWAPYLDDAAAAYIPHTLVAGLAPPVTYTYDAIGRLLTTADPDGAVSAAAYSDWSVTATDANGHQTRRTSDAYGRLAKVEEFIAGQTATTTYGYDTLDNLIRVQQWGLSPEGTVPIADTTITYDSLGRKVGMDDPDMGVWAYAYDAVDNLVSQTDARGVVTAFTYDTLNRLTQKSYTIPGGSGIANPGSVTYVYDDATKPFRKGKLSGIADGSGSSAFEYDNLGRLIKETKTVDGTPYTIQRQYDLLGRLTALTYPDGEVVDYTYNAQGGIETINGRGLGPEGGLSPAVPYVSNMDYNPAGQITKIAYGNGVVTDYAYNPQTLRLDRLLTDGPGGRLQDFTYAFDPAGNVSSITDAVHTGSQTFEYDDLNRLTRATGAYGDLRYAYDPLGNMLEKEGVTMAYGEGAAGPHAVTSTSAGMALTYDANGNLVSKRLSEQPLLEQLLAYDAENRLVDVQTAQDSEVAVTFQPGWNFFALPVLPADGAVVVLLPTFAADFEQIAKFEPATNSFIHYVGNPKFDDFSTLEYGSGYQVFCKAASPVTVTFRGKAPTKRLAKSLAPGWHLLPAISNQQTAVSTVFGSLSPTAVKRYDAATTSLQTATQVEPGQAYWVQLATSATWTPPLPQDVSTRFTYDGDGGRVKQVTAAGTTTYLGETYEKDATGKTTKYVFAGSLRIAAKDSTGTLRFYHGDHLGSSHVITDGTGQLVELTEHTPYGSLSRTEGSYDSPFKFTGQRQDPGTGLILFPARAYDPELGRFLQADPFVQDPSDPQTLNRYAYVRNNPINLVDPTGHFFFAIFAAIVAITKVAAVGAAVGAAVNAGIAAVTGGDVGKAALSGAGFGATFAVAGALAAPALASATAAAQAGSALARVGAFTIQAAQFGAAGAVGGGIDSSYDGGSFGRGAGTGALVSVATFGAGKALGPVFNQIGEAIGPQLAQVGQAVASSSVGQQLGRYFAQGSDDAVYAGVRHASSFLQQLGVSRDVRVKLLSTVDPRTVGLDFAGTSSYALRYFGGRARARGHALFDTFPATRDSLAVKLDWNTMEFFKQWQIRPGAPIIYGRALPQGGLSGGQMQRGVIDPLRDLLD